MGLRSTSEPQARIASVGGAEGGNGWRLSEEEAIAAIEERRIGFYVIVGGSAREVIVGEHLNRRYLKTDADRLTPSLLLALAECADGSGED